MDCDCRIMRATGKERRKQGGAGNRMEPPGLDGSWGTQKRPLEPTCHASSWTDLAAIWAVPIGHKDCSQCGVSWDTQCHWSGGGTTHHSGASCCRWGWEQTGHPGPHPLSEPNICPVSMNHAPTSETHPSYALCWKPNHS